MATSKSDISISLGLDFAAMSKSLAQVEKSVAASMSAIKTIVLTTAALIGVGFTIKGISNGIGGALAYGKALDTVSRQTQIAVRDIVLMEHALDRSGVSATEAGEILGTLRNNVRNGATGFGEAGLALNRLGVSYETLQKLSLPKQFELLASEVNKIQDPITRAAIATQIFGDAGAKAVANFQSGDLAQAARLFGANAERMQKAAAAMAFIQDAWSRIKGAGAEFFAAMTSRLVPLLKPILDAVQEIIPKIIEAGNLVGETIYKFTAAMLGAAKLSIIGELISAGVDVAIDKLQNGFIHLVSFLSELFQSLASPLVSVLQYAFQKAVPVFAQLMATAVAATVGALQQFLGTIDDRLTRRTAQGNVDKFKKTREQLLDAQAKGEKTVTTDSGYKLSVNDEVIKRNQEMLAAYQRAVDEKTASINKAYSPEQKEEDAATSKQFGSDVKDWFTDLVGAADPTALSSALNKAAGVIGKAGDVWKSTAPEVTEEEKKRADKFNGLIDRAFKAGDDLIKKNQGKQPGAKPGDPNLGGKPLNAVPNMNFDELRRIGGGIGGNIQGMQQRKIDLLQQIAQNTSAWLNRQNQPGFTKGYQQVGKNFGLPGTGGIGVSQ